MEIDTNNGDNNTNVDISMTGVDDNGDEEEPKKKQTSTNNGVTSTTKKRRRLKQMIDSDDEEEDDEEVRQTTEKPGNEVEVSDKHDKDDATSLIFVPPVASGQKKPPVATKINKDRPPSEIFLKELKRFCREAIRSGCVSLAELKEVLAVRQKGLIPAFFSNFRKSKLHSPKISKCTTAQSEVKATLHSLYRNHEAQNRQKIKNIIRICAIGSFSVLKNINKGTHK